MAASQQQELVRVLSVEDSPNDRSLMQAVADFLSPPLDLVTLESFQAACDHFSRLASAPELLPDLVLLDYNLANRTGTELIPLIRANQALAQVPVVILTSSEAPEDILNSYKSGATYYFTKPAGFGRFQVLMAALRDSVSVAGLRDAPFCLPEYRPPPIALVESPVTRGCKPKAAGRA